MLMPIQYKMLWLKVSPLVNLLETKLLPKYEGHTCILNVSWQVLLAHLKDRYTRNLSESGNVKQIIGTVHLWIRTTDRLSRPHPSKCHSHQAEDPRRRRAFKLWIPAMEREQEGTFGGRSLNCQMNILANHVVAVVYLNLKWEFLDRITKIK